jgi:hypothetical protein
MADKLKCRGFKAMEEEIRCAHCREIIDDRSKAVTLEIFGRDRKTFWDNRKKRYVSKAFVTSSFLKFCSKECADHEQMAREG